MAVTYRPTDYLYLSARLRAREAALVGKDRLARLAELGSAEEALSALISEGVLDGDAKSDPEGALNALLREEYATVRAAAPDPALFAFLLYPTDCHNLKSLLKCHYRGVSPDALLIDAGSIPTEELADLFERVPDTVPAHMRAAVDEARVAFDRTGDPREIDFLLDAACFADMSENAAALPLAAELVRARADMINLSSCRRLIRMRAGEAGAVMLQRAFLPGGTIGCETLSELYAEGESAFAAYAARSAYAAVFEGATAAEAERRADDYYLQIARRAKETPFGAEVVIGYLVGLEYAVKNLRILLVAKAGNADARVLAGRLRESYV